MTDKLKVINILHPNSGEEWVTELLDEGKVNLFFESLGDDVAIQFRNLDKERVVMPSRVLGECVFTEIDAEEVF